MGLSGSSLPRRLAVCGIIIFPIMLAVGTLLARFLPCPTPDQYLVLLDAGSVHTSIYTYRLNGRNGTLPVEEIGSCELGETGVSSFAESPQRAAEFLANHPCLASALSLVPNISRPYSSVDLGGTAGLRVLRLASPQLASQILGNITAALSSAAPGMKTSARILLGQEEAEDGWVTANYLNGSLGLDGDDIILPKGALDWGGASSQITALAPTSGFPLAIALEEREFKTVEVDGIAYDVVSTSHLCYGQAEAVNRHRADLVYQLYLDAGHTLPSPIKVSDPCLPREASLNITLASLFSSPCTHYRDSGFMELIGKDLASNITLVPGDPSLCQAAASKAFDFDHCIKRYVQPKTENICMDPLTIVAPTNQTYFAFSTYWYLATSMRLNKGPVSAPFAFTKEMYDKSLRAICNSSLAELKRDPKDDGWGLKSTAHVACFQASFLEALLTQGYHFAPEDWSNIVVVKRLGQPPAEVGWTLGQALLVADGQEEQNCISDLAFVGLLCSSILLLLIGVGCAVHAYSKGHLSSRFKYERLP